MIPLLDIVARTSFIGLVGLLSSSVVAEPLSGTSSCDARDGSRRRGGRGAVDHGAAAVEPAPAAGRGAAQIQIRVG